MPKEKRFLLLLKLHKLNCILNLDINVAFDWKTNIVLFSIRGEKTRIWIRTS